MLKNLIGQFRYARLMNKKLRLYDLAKATEQLLWNKDADKHTHALREKVLNYLFLPIGWALEAKYSGIIGGQRLNASDITAAFVLFGTDQPAPIKRILDEQIILEHFVRAISYALGKLNETEGDNATKIGGADFLQKFLFSVCNTVGLGEEEKGFCWSLACEKAVKTIESSG